MQNTRTVEADVVQRIKHILVEDLQLKLDLDRIPDDYSLLEGGLALDSIVIAELIVQIENRFGLQLDERVLEADLLENLSALAAFVADECRAARTSEADGRLGGTPC